MFQELSQALSEAEHPQPVAGRVMSDGAWELRKSRGSRSRHCCRGHALIFDLRPRAIATEIPGTGGHLLPDPGAGGRQVFLALLIPVAAGISAITLKSEAHQNTSAVPATAGAPAAKLVRITLHKRSTHTRNSSATAHRHHRCEGMGTQHAYVSAREEEVPCGRRRPVQQYAGRRARRRALPQLPRPPVAPGLDAVIIVNPNFAANSARGYRSRTPRASSSSSRAAPWAPSSPRTRSSPPGAETTPPRTTPPIRTTWGLPATRSPAPPARSPSRRLAHS